jgi:hypothetical protein
MKRASSSAGGRRLLDCDCDCDCEYVGPDRDGEAFGAGTLWVRGLECRDD